MVSFGGLARKLFGSSNERRVKSYRPQVQAINALEESMKALSDEQLEALKAHIAAREATKKTAASAESDEPASGAPASGDSASDETTEN